MHVAILHYAAPPVVGGVEQTIYHHARHLANAGYAVRVLAGEGEQFDRRVEVAVVPEFGSRHPDVLVVKGQLDRGQATRDFVALRDRLAALLSEALAGVDVLIGHNIFTLHKNLALTAALHELIQRSRSQEVTDQNSCGAGRPNGLTVLAWHHDLAWDDPRYRNEVHSGYPWDLLRRPWPGIRHVTVSAAQQARLVSLFAIAPEYIVVVPPGVEPAGFFGWTGTMCRLADELHLLKADLLFLLPARLTRRKNVEMALRILAALRAQTGLDARLIVTGPPGPHNPANAAYLKNLLGLRRKLGLADRAHLLYELGITPDDATMANLYQLADALLFPSMQEGFGIPLLEAGLARLPVFCSDILALHETGGDAARFFDPKGDPAAIAAQIADALKQDAAHSLRRRVLSHHIWRRVVEDTVIPLLEARGEPDQGSSAG